MGRTITDKTARPVYQHFIYDSNGVYLYLSYSFNKDEQKEYTDIMDIKSNIMKEYSEYIKSLPVSEKKAALDNLPIEQSWKNGIQLILPQNDYTNNGSIRRKNLIKRLEAKYPLMADILYEEELAARPDYFNGNDEGDKYKAEVRKNYTNEYWEAYMLASATNQSKGA